MELPRLGIISFNIEGLHHDLVSVLLDHLFGIQNRAGCSCAGPYGHRLLGIDRDRSERFRDQIRKGVLGIKPGWVRVSLPSFGSPEDIDFILSAVEFVAEHGLDFVPMYRLRWHDGVWEHIEKPMRDAQPLELTVEALSEAANTFAAGDHEAPLSEAQLKAERQSYFTEATAVAQRLRAQWTHGPPKWNPPSGKPGVDELVWFRYLHAS
jgi:hypothetical protein